MNAQKSFAGFADYLLACSVENGESSVGSFAGFAGFADYLLACLTAQKSFAGFADYLLAYFEKNEVATRD